MKINEKFMEEFGKVYSEEQLNDKELGGRWKHYPLNEKICDFISKLCNEIKTK